MDQQIKVLVNEYKTQFEKFKEYLDQSDWVSSSEITLEEDYEVERDIINNVVKNIKDFKVGVEGSEHLKSVQNVINLAEKIIRIHIKRIDSYLQKNDWTKMFSKEMEALQSSLDKAKTAKQKDTIRNEIDDLQKRKKQEIQFQNDIFTQKTKSATNLLKNNITSDSSSKMSFETFGNKKVPLLMAKTTSDLFPSINSYVEQKGIVYPSPEPLKSSELLINMKESDIPPYNEKKHFWEQEKSTIDFWIEEMQKIKYGLNINGYLFDPWFYWHVNIFKIAVGDRNDKKIINPDLRDNEYFFNEMFRECERKRDRGLMMYGTRRFAKSTILASKTLHVAYTVDSANCTVQGFTEKPDLAAIATNMQNAVTNMYPAFKIGNNKKDYLSEVELGFKLKDSSPIVQSRINIINLEDTSKKGSQKTAGATPDSFIFDEVGKGPCKKPWLAAIPSFQSPDGWLTTPILSGTAGESSLSKDAEDMLKDPRAYDLELMDFDMLEKHIDPEYITWKRDTFAFFVPGQLNRDTPKIETNLADFTGHTENKGLQKIKIKKTDWKTATEKRLKKRKQLKHDRDALNDEKRFSPIKIEDVFISGETNKYPSEEARIHSEKIIKEGEDGLPVIIKYNETSKIFSLENTSKKPIRQYPFNGGIHDAPIMILDKVSETERPPFGQHVLGLDDVKYDQSDGDSVISAHVYRRGIVMGEWADRVVAYFASRPQRKELVYEQIYMLMLYYNAIVFYENADNGFKDYLERKKLGLAEKHLAPSVDWGKSMMSQGLNYSKNRPYGWYPSPKNINHLNNRVLDYTLDTEFSHGGLGVYRINDPMLLKEFELNKPKINADRIRSFGLALIYAEYLDKEGLYRGKRKWGGDNVSDKSKKEKSKIKMQNITQRRTNMKRY